MNDFGVSENARSPFLGLERRRDCEGVPKWSLFGEGFAIFGTFFAKSVSFFAKMERNGAVFEDFEKGGVVMALAGDLNHEAHEAHEEGKTLDRMNGIELATNCTNYFFYRINKIDRIGNINHESHESSTADLWVF